KGVVDGDSVAPGEQGSEGALVVAHQHERIGVGVGPRHLPRLTHFRLDAADAAYGMTPLHYAPTPQSRWRGLFSDETIASHLDRLEADQQRDGGWAITWEPPSRAATL